jgi:hypothetical protein
MQKPLGGRAAPRGAHAAWMPHETALNPLFWPPSAERFEVSEPKKQSVARQPANFFPKKEFLLLFFIFFWRSLRVGAFEEKSGPQKSLPKKRAEKAGRKKRFPLHLKQKTRVGRARFTQLFK